MIYSVSEVNYEIKSMLEYQENFRNIFIRGEISNYKRHTSGHHYMTLKDQEAALSAVMFRTDAAKLRLVPRNGMQVIARGRIGVFVKSGQYQLYITDMISDGAGDLHLRFEELKEKLYAEGLFDPARKKALPKFPKCIGIVTSPTGAAVQDMLRILNNRYPPASVRLYPVLVQGEGAPSAIAEALKHINEEGLCDLIITGRGGGSIEDLWAFNTETVARAISGSRIPVVSAVGHEPDVTIADFVADVRASTPSNAAELCVPDQQELTMLCNNLYDRLKIAAKAAVAARNMTLLHHKKRLQLRNPQMQIEESRMLLAHLSDRMQAFVREQHLRERNRFSKAVAYLDACNPIKVLARGYSIVSDETKQIIRDGEYLEQGDCVTIQFHRNKARCTVTEIIKDEE